MADGLGGVQANPNINSSWWNQQQFNPPTFKQDNAKIDGAAPAGNAREAFLTKNGLDTGEFQRSKLFAAQEQNAAQQVRLDPRSERTLAKVNPELAARVRLMAADLQKQGINIVVTDGLRTFDEQNALYAQGRTKPGNIVTNARGGQSFHNYGLAVDIYEMKNGQPNFKPTAATQRAIGAAGEKYGLEWGGKFKTINDPPHFQLSGGAKSASAWLPTYNKGGVQAVWNEVNKKLPTLGGGAVTPPVDNGGNNNGVTRLEKGATGPQVEQLQRDLTKLGYKATPDGDFGLQTDAAVRKFQADQKLEVDGIAGPKTRAALDAALQQLNGPRLKKGATGAQVEQLQRDLTKAGFPAKPDGEFGPKTDAALRNFQRANGLEADGIYGPQTRAAMAKALNGNAPTAPTTPVNPPPAVNGAQAERLNNILKGTGLANQGETILRYAKQYNVPAELAVSMFRMEASFNTKGLAPLNNNPGNIRYVGQEGATRGAGGMAKWPTVEKGIEAYFKLLNRGYRQFIDNKDWAGLVNKYAPPIENDSRAYTRNITNWMEQYRRQIFG
jgi:peptidoglycan hydrolase-like protein with peptidoglycan-binding domain